jgi:hypothetical protein
MSDKYYEYFLNSKSNVVYYDLIEISHPNFSQTYRKVRNNTGVYFFWRRQTLVFLDAVAAANETDAEIDCVCLIDKSLHKFGIRRNEFVITIHSHCSLLMQEDDATFLT